MGEVTITEANFETEVLQSELPVLVDFWADWCGPCRMLAPLIEDLAKEYEGRIKVGKVNVDEQQELAMKYRVVSIPTLVLFREGQAVNRLVGAVPKGRIEEMLNA
ncbi:MAG: thioredoxin [Lachnospiraceae bacterium]|nr:thioredoxin [Lachnospiraceae bacterium]